MSANKLFRSVNPKNNQLIATVEAMTNAQLETSIERAYQSYRTEYGSGQPGLHARFDKLQRLCEVMRANKTEFAGLITQEMGKPTLQAQAEIDRCITHVEYYLQNTESFLEDEQLSLSNKHQSAKIRHQPLGPTLGKLKLTPQRILIN